MDVFGYGVSFIFLYVYIFIFLYVDISLFLYLHIFILLGELEPYMKSIKLVSIWNPKGGQGKSMLAINLAAAAVEMGIKPLVVCQDPQGTSTKYYKAGKLPFKVVSEIPRERPDADIVFFDHQASDWELPPNQLVVMPVKPSRDQFTTYAEAFKMAENAGKQVLTIVTGGANQRVDERATAKALQSKGALEVPASGVFSRAASGYKTIFDKSLDRAYKIRDRRRDLSRILAELLLEQEEERSHVAA